jgi:integrase
VSGTNAVSKVLTRDNILLSRPTMDNEDATNSDVVIAQEIATAERAVTCKSEPSDTVRAYVEAGIAPATRRAYKADLEHFRAWGGDIPTIDLQLAAYSGHSLRAGFATSATRAGVATFKIRQQTGHASDSMLSRYVRQGELFLGNAAGFLL